MDLVTIPENQLSPIAIGGVGGSGTRLIASYLEELNYYIGSDLNPSKDNLWFTLLFKHIEVLNYTNEELHELLNIFLQGMINKEQLSYRQKQIVRDLIHEQRHLPKAFFQARADSLFSNYDEPFSNQYWGWKEPNTHIILDRLLQYLPHMKYIHVIRNGLDMAYSSNQNQQLLWGKKFLGSDFEQNPYYSLKYWCMVHKRLLKITKDMKPNFLLLNYDDFCANPGTEIPKLLKFLNIPISDMSISKLRALIRIPSSIGRYKEFDTNIFDQEDIDFVEKLGFCTQ